MNNTLGFFCNPAVEIEIRQDVIPICGSDIVLNNFQNFFEIKHTVVYLRGVWGFNPPPPPPKCMVDMGIGRN